VSSGYVFYHQLQFWVSYAEGRMLLATERDIRRPIGLSYDRMLAAAGLRMGRMNRLWRRCNLDTGSCEAGLPSLRYEQGFIAQHCYRLISAWNCRIPGSKGKCF
jgi:hypothetical protein